MKVWIQYLCYQRCIAVSFASLQTEQNRETLQNLENVSNEMNQERNATPFSFVWFGFLSSGLILTDISNLNIWYSRGPGHNPDVTGSWFLF